MRSAVMALGDFENLLDSSSLLDYGNQPLGVIGSG